MKALRVRRIGSELAEFVTELSYEDIPASVVSHAKWLVLDLLGVAIMGERHPSAGGVKMLVRSLGSSGLSTMIGHKTRVTCSWAAFANAAFAQVHDANDGHVTAGSFGGFSHPGRIVVPTAFALGEQETATGRELLTAIVVGYEVMCRIRGRNPQPPTGSYGAAAVGARLLGLSADETLHAIGIAGHLDPRRKQYLSGSDANHITSGYIARLGVDSALLAKFGSSGPPIYDERTLTTRYKSKGLGSEYEILNTYTKPYPTCRMTHAAVDAVLALRDQIENPTESITEVRIHQVSPGMYVTEPDVTFESSHKTCEFSLPYVVAVALVDGHVGESQFTADRIADQRIHSLMKRIHVVADDELDAQYLVRDMGLFEPRPATVHIVLSDGQVLSKTVLYPKGHPRNPLTDEERKEQFRNHSEPSLGADRTRRLMESILRLEDARDPTEVMESLLDEN